MWIRKFSKQNELSGCIKINENNEIVSLIQVTSNEAIKFNIWENVRHLEYKKSLNEIGLCENYHGEKFFRFICKTKSKKNLFLPPKYKKTFSLEDDSFTSFNINQKKLEKWKIKMN